MLAKGPHISIEAEALVPRLLRISSKDFADWPAAVRQLAVDIAKELFLVRYNPFISAETVKKSVQERFESARRGLAHHYATSISEGITIFWSAHEGDMAFKKELINRLKGVLPPESIDSRVHSLIDNATDATDLRIELPLLVVTPQNAEEVAAVVCLANEMQFALVPRGGGSGLTGGAVPARKRSVILSLTKLTRIVEVNEEDMTITAQAGVITNDVFKAAAEKNLLFSVDPASKIASSIGGNVAENAGGPLCFEYGTTIDNLLSYRMVTPTGELIEVARKDHPRRAIAPDDTVVFEVRDISGGMRNRIELHASDIRTPGLGKDVTNKALKGLPGVQKEGTDGVIVDATFTLHMKHAFYKVMVFEFFGRSMESCMHVVNNIVALRDSIRGRGDLVKITALEEFGIKYVQAIGYLKKSTAIEGDPISVLIVQLDSDDEAALAEAVEHVKEAASEHAGVDVFVAEDDKQAELFWEDRHKLSAIAKRTSGFKINEDVVIPVHAIPDFALFLEALNLEYMARAYRTALKEVEELPGVAEDEQAIGDEIGYANRIIHKEIIAADLSDQELQLHAVLFLRSLGEKYPGLAEKIADVEKRLISTAICVASHMHAGDGNWHVNIPVNSNDPRMMHHAGKVAALVMQKAQDLGGEVTGEHGIGITKIAFLTDEKMAAIKDYKQAVDPRNIFNPAKLTQRTLPGTQFTFSFNHLIRDLQQSGVADKERLITLLGNVQVCTRCGKCKQFCPMYYPEQGMLYHPRNKNLILGALIEAIYYSQVNHGKPDPALLKELQSLTEHCTGCGKCMASCPVKIASGEVALTLRGILEDEGAGGHPIKSRVLNFLAEKPAVRIPMAAKVASLGQGVQNSLMSILPAGARQRFSNPLFSGKGPRPGLQTLMGTIDLEASSIFIPQGEKKGTVLYFPGCGGAVFYRYIGLAGLALLLRAGYAVVLPQKHLCCGYPLLSAGAQDAFAVNQDRNITHLRALATESAAKGYPIGHVLTACGSCRDGMERHFIPHVFPLVEGREVELSDVGQFLFALMSEHGDGAKALFQSEGLRHLLYHAPCHAEKPGVHKLKAGTLYAKELAEYSGAKVALSPGCCGESGMGAITAPEIYNKIRMKKQEQLDRDLQKIPASSPVVVSCPSCKMGISRILLNEHEDRPVLHTLELLAWELAGKKWRQKLKKLLRSAPVIDGVHVVPMDQLPTMQLTEEESRDDADES